MTGYCDKESFRNTGRFANESLRQRPLRQRMKSVHQHLYASDFGSQCENTFSFGSKVNERTRINSLLLSSGYTYLAVCLALQWMKERGIIDMHVRVKVALYSVVWWCW